MSVHPDATPFEVSASYPASRVRLTRIPAGMREVAWHTVPEPNLTIRLDRSVEYETSDGEVRRVQAGGFVLVADTHGKGHLSRHSEGACYAERAGRAMMATSTDARRTGPAALIAAGESLAIFPHRGRPVVEMKSHRPTFDHHRTRNPRPRPRQEPTLRDFAAERPSHA